jgi:hypothetical protein
MARRMRRTTATATDCGACGLPLLTQHVECLDITVDATPIEPGTDAEHRDPHHLTWCALPTGTGPPRLRWIYGWHPTPCPYPHHAEHRCTAPRRHSTTPQAALF